MHPIAVDEHHDSSILIHGQQATNSSQHFRVVFLWPCRRFTSCQQSKRCGSTYPPESVRQSIVFLRPVNKLSRFLAEALGAFWLVRMIVSTVSSQSLWRRGENQNDFAHGRQKCRPTRTLPRRGTNVAHLRQPLCELDPCRDLALYRCGLRLLSTSRPARPVVAKSVRLSAILPHSGATSRCGSARRLRCHAASVLLFAHCDQHECTCGNSALIDARIKREKNRCSVLTHGSNVCKTNVVEAMKMTLTDMFTTWVRKRSAAF